MRYYIQTFQPLELENREVCITAFPTIHNPLKPIVSCWPWAFKRLMCTWFSKMNMSCGHKEASHSLFVKTTRGLVGLWKKTGEINYMYRKQLWDNYSQLWNTFDFGTTLRFAVPFPHLSLTTNSCLCNLNLSFCTVPKIGRFQINIDTNS